MTTSSARARERVRRALRTARARLPRLFQPGTRLVVAYSGGQDSTALLHALAHSHRGLDILAAHVDHALRADSAEAAQRVAELASSMGVTPYVTRVDVRRYREGLNGWSIQQAARAARYQALATIVEQHHAAALLVAHTADDQAETLLLHLLRGSGLTGLSGMRLEESIDPSRMGPPIEDVRPPPEHLTLVRPLLRVSRSSTLAYCTHFGLPIVEDASNSSRAYARNRVRLELLPALEQFNPSIRTVLARTADLLSEDEAALDEVVSHFFESSHVYDLERWRAQRRAIQRRLLRRALNDLVGELVDIGDAPIEDALDLLQTAQPNQTYHLPYGVELCVSSQNFSLQPYSRARSRTRGNTWERQVPRV